MSGDDWREQLPIRVRTMQIIVGALCFGCFNFLIIALLITTSRNEAADKFLTCFGLVAAGMILGIWIILPGVIVSQGRKKIRQTLHLAVKQVSNKSIGDDVENNKALLILALFQTKTIISGALLEGAAFLLLTLYIVEASMLFVIVAVAFLILLVVQIPTTGRVTNWVENQIRLVDEEQALG